MYDNIEVCNRYTNCVLSTRDVETMLYLIKYDLVQYVVIQLPTSKCRQPG
jgi:hypothetical protein